MHNRTRKNKINNNATIKAKTMRNNKCIKQILQEYKRQQRGHIAKDYTTRYKGDYYLSLGKKDNWNKHIHLITKKFYTKKHKKPVKNKHVIGYAFKKSKHNHSKSEVINTNLHPKKIVSKMIKKYRKFIHE